MEEVFFWKKKEPSMEGVVLGKKIKIENRKRKRRRNLQKLKRNIINMYYVHYIIS